MSNFTPSSVNELVRIGRELLKLKTGYNSWNLGALESWLNTDGERIVELAEDTRNYIHEVLDPDYPDQQLILNHEYERVAS